MYYRTAQCHVLLLHNKYIYLFTSCLDTETSAKLVLLYYWMPHRKQQNDESESTGDVPVQRPTSMERQP